MNPLALMNNDMATLRMSSEKVFELWNDSVSTDLKKHCVEALQSRWNSYLTEMNARVNIYMRAEKEIDTIMKKLVNLERSHD